MKKILLLLIISMVSVRLVSEQYYKIEFSKSEYQEIQDDNLILYPNFGNDTLTLVPFEKEFFNFFGVEYEFTNYNALYVQTYGNLRIDNNTSVIIIDGVFTTLDSIDENTKVSWKFENVGDEKIFKAQWKNVKLAMGLENNYTNFQIWLYQKSGVIELRYGESSENNSSGFKDKTGPYAGIFYSSNTFDKLYEKNWLYGEPDNLLVDSTQNFSFKNIYGIPENGTVVSIIPKKKDNLTVNEINNKKKVLIIPNPTEDYIYINLENIKINELKIYNIDGKLVYSKLEIVDGKIDVSDLIKGTYILNIITDDGVYSEKFIRK